MFKIKKAILLLSIFLLFSSFVVAEDCTDSDGGRNYYVKGDLSGTFEDGTYSSVQDSCCVNCISASSYEGPYLGEYYCNNEIAKRDIYTCPNGCRDGACIINEPKCIDSDGGKNYNVKGKVTLSDSTILEDTCGLQRYEGYVIEYNCEDESYVENYKCPNGCNNGKCLKLVPEELKEEETRCYDSDNGRTYYVKGTVDYYEDNMDSTFIDKCRYESIDPNSKILDEGYCEGNRFRFESYECPNGCRDGACLKLVPEEDQISFCKDNICTLYEGQEVQETIKSKFYHFRIKSISSSGVELEINKRSIGILKDGESKIIGNLKLDIWDVETDVTRFAVEYISCDGCLDPLNNCIPYGIRLGNKFCDIDKEIKLQFEEGMYCNNNYECTTNLCINNECIGKGFLENIFAWFKRIFG